MSDAVREVNEQGNGLLDIDFSHTGEISIPTRIIDQVIGQNEAEGGGTEGACQQPRR